MAQFWPIVLNEFKQENNKSDLSNVSNDIFNLLSQFFTRLEIVLLSHTNKSLRTHAFKYKNIKFAGYFDLNIDRFGLNRGLHLESNKLCFNAAAKGYLDVLIYFRQLNLIWSECVTIQAALGGHIEILKWTMQNNLLITHSDTNIGYHLTTCAALKGELKILKWARDNNLRLSEHIPSFAAFNGHYKIVEWAVLNGVKLDWQVISYAALNGHLNIMILAKQYGCVWSQSVNVDAASNGHLHILKYAISNRYGFPLSSRICAHAASNGHLHFLKYAISNGCPTSSEMCQYAAYNGHSNILKWIRMSLPNSERHWDNNVYIRAVEKTDLEYFKWTYNTFGKEEYLMNTNVLLQAFKCKRVDIIKYIMSLNENDITIGDNFKSINEKICVNAVKMKSLSVLKWARKNGCKWNSDVCIEAILNKQWHILEWATNNGCEWNSRVIEIVLSQKIINCEGVINIIKNIVFDKYIKRTFESDDAI